MVRPLYLFLAIGIIVVVAFASGSYLYLSGLNHPIEKTSSSDHTILINIPLGSHVYPIADWNTTRDLLYGHQFRFKYMVVVGVNNTIEWVNHDNFEHTVDFYQFPTGAHLNSSGFIRSNGGTFTETLTVPGIYNYTCIWHNWLAGQITVKNS